MDFAKVDKRNRFDWPVQNFAEFDLTRRLVRLSSRC